MHHHAALNYILQGPRLLLRLVFQFQRSHPVRFLATLLALACSVSAIVWLVGGYERLFSQTEDNASHYLGRFDALVAPGVLSQPDNRSDTNVRAVSQTPSRRTKNAEEEKRVPSQPGTRPARREDASEELPPLLIERLKAHTNVQAIVLSQATRVSVSSENSIRHSISSLTRDKAPVLGAPPLDPYLISTEDLSPIYPLDVGRWLDGDSVVITHSVAKSLNVELGQTIRVTSANQQSEWTVCGIVSQPEDSPALPGVTILSTHAIYATPEQHQRIVGQPFKPSHAHLVLESHTADAYKSIHQTIQDTNVRYAFLDDTQIARGLAQSRKLNTSHGNAWSVSLLASLASLIVIGAIMNANVRERRRELAMLRVIGWSRSRVLFTLLLETLLLTILGWIVGIFVGHWLVQLVVPSTVSTYTLIPGKLTLISSFLCVTVGGLLASVIPLWRAGRLSPMDAMTQGTVDSSPLSLSRFSYLGIALLALGIAANSPIAADSNQRLTWVRYAAYPLLLAGVACLLPLITQVLIRATSPILSKLFKVDRQLLTESLSMKSNLWASLTFALSIGLSILLATQIWGNSMLQTFLPGKWIPDALIALQIDEPKPTPQVADSQIQHLGPALWKELKKIPGVSKETISPLFVEQSRILWDDSHKTTGLGADNAVVIGVGAEQTLSGENPLLPLDWIAGSADQPWSDRQDGCIVSEDFCIRNDLKLGDVIQFQIPNKPGEKTTLTITAIVRMTGWHWLTKFSGLRKRYVRTGTMILARAENVQKSFHLSQPEFCWLNTVPETDLLSLEKKITALAISLRQAMASSTTDTAASQSNIESAPWLRMTTRQAIDDSIRIRSRQYLWAMCYLPLYTMLLFSVAVACTLFSFVKMRSWDFGVIRSLGFNRWFLVRWIAAEGVFLAIAVSLTSLAFGMIAGWGGLTLARYEGFFAGPAPWVLPPREITLGVLTAFGLCGLSVLWPAWFVGTRPILELLQSRSSSRQ